MLPELNEAGYLPRGIHQSNLVEVQQRFGTTERRRDLLQGLFDFVEIARNSGAKKLLLDGSFVTDKEIPGDIDAILIVPNDFDTATQEARLLLASQSRFNIHLFPVREGNDVFLQHWVHFFGHDRDNEPKGLVEVSL